MSVFIVSVDGPDLSGKTTTSTLLVDALRKEFPECAIKHSVLPSSMVTGAFTMMLRSLKEDVSAEVFALAYALDHLHHNKIIVKPLVEDSRDYILVLERSLLTTLIYQSQMLGADLKWMEEVNKYVKYLPNLSIILRLEKEELLKRKEVEKKQFDKFETDEMIEKQIHLYADIPEELKQKYNVQYVDVNGQGVQGVVQKVVEKVKEFKK